MYMSKDMYMGHGTWVHHHAPPTTLPVIILAVRPPAAQQRPVWLSFVSPRARAAALLAALIGGIVMPPRSAAPPLKRRHLQFAFLAEAKNDYGAGPVRTGLEGRCSPPRRTLDPSLRMLPTTIPYSGIVVGPLLRSVLGLGGAATALRAVSASIIAG